MGAIATLESKSANVQPGGETSVRIKVQNSGQVVDEFSIQVIGDPGAWAAATPPVLRLFPGQEDFASITFRPPRSAQTASGQLPFAVRVQSRQDPEGSYVEEGVLAVGSFAEATAELIPRNSRGTRRGVHEVAVDNRGNAAIQATLTASDQDKLLDFRFSPSALPVPAGGAGFSRLRVRPRQSFWRGQPKSRAFQVRIQPDGAPPISLDGTLVQGPLLASWMVPAALGAIGLLVAAALLWNFAVKPGFQSLARDAVISPTPVAAVNTGGGNHSGGGGQPSPTATASSGGTSSAPSIDFAQRLAPSSGGAYKAPANTTLYITDLVFNNPSAENGPISFTRDGVHLLDENLSNFRDLDYHFVTPIQVNPNQTVALAGACAACSVLITGYEKTS